MKRIRSFVEGSRVFHWISVLGAIITLYSFLAPTISSVIRYLSSLFDALLLTLIPALPNQSEVAFLLALTFVSASVLIFLVSLQKRLVLWMRLLELNLTHHLTERLENVFSEHLNALNSKPPGLYYHRASGEKCRISGWYRAIGDPMAEVYMEVDEIFPVLMGEYGDPVDTVWEFTRKEPF